MPRLRKTTKFYVPRICYRVRDIDHKELVKLKEKTGRTMMDIERYFMDLYILSGGSLNITSALVLNSESRPKTCIMSIQVREALGTLAKIRGLPIRSLIGNIIHYFVDKSRVKSTEEALKEWLDIKAMMSTTLIK